MLFFWTFYSSKNPKKYDTESRFTQKYETAQLFSTLIIIRNVSNDAENSALTLKKINCILKFITIENIYFKL